MTEERFVAIEGVNYPVLISDEYQALQAALAAGRAVVVNAIADVRTDYNG